MYETTTDPPQIRASNGTEAMPKEGEHSLLMVDVKGEVLQPGVYEAEPGMRIKDIIKEAGGFTQNANETVVNLAQKVHDEMVILVPAEDDNPASSGSASYIDDQVRINYATQSDIETLTGIGPSKAAAIIDHREEHGYFQSIDDLLNVSGIGEKTLDNIRDLIQVP